MNHSIHIASTLLMTLATSLAQPSLNTSQTNKPEAAIVMPSVPPLQLPRPKFGPAQIIKQKLNLSDEQTRALDIAIKQQQATVAGLRNDPSLSRQERIAKMKAAGETASAKFKATLTPEQAAKWQQITVPQQNVLLQHVSARTNRETINLTRANEPAAKPPLDGRAASPNGP
jgi:hypothetical protein